MPDRLEWRKKKKVAGREKSRKEPRGSGRSFEEANSVIGTPQSI